MLVSKRYWTHLGFFLPSRDRSLPKRQYSGRTFYNTARKSPKPGYCCSRRGDPWPAEGAASFVPRPRRERAQGARGLHAAQAPTLPARGCCSRRGLTTLWLSPRALCWTGFLTLGRRRTPAPLQAPVAPFPLGPRLHSNHPAKPRAALPPRPAFLTGSRRRRRLPGTAPAPPRGAGGRGSFSPLLTKQRSRRHHRARVSLVRAPASAAPPRLPRPRCARTHRLPSPPRTVSPASAARPASCARPPALPLPTRVRFGRGTREVGRARESIRARRASHLCPGRSCACAQESSSSARRASPRRRACAERAPLRRWWRRLRQVGGWVGEAVVSAGKGWPSRPENRNEDLRLRA